jgi:hypothetical protein
MRLAALVMLLAGCAGPRAAMPDPEPLDDDAIAAWSPGGEPTGSPVVRLASRERAEDLDRFAVRRIGEARQPIRHGRRRRIDVAFDGADLPNALRLLADAAGLQLVVADGVGGTISARWTRIDPVDAMVMLAETHGASVELRGRFAVVMPAAAIPRE